MLTCKVVAAEATIDLRHRVLRPHQERDDCYYPGDSDPQAIHLAAFANTSIVAVCTAYPEILADQDFLAPFRLRGMAVAPTHQKNGVGRLILNDLEARIWSSGGDFLWFNARTSAHGFYQKLGYEVTGDAFEIEPIGMHYVMFKRLVLSAGDQIQPSLLA